MTHFAFVKVHHVRACFQKSPANAQLEIFHHRMMKSTEYRWVAISLQSDELRAVLLHRVFVTFTDSYPFLTYGHLYDRYSLEQE